MNKNSPTFMFYYMGFVITIVSFNEVFKLDDCKLNCKFPLFLPLEKTVVRYVIVFVESYNLISGGTVTLITPPARTGLLS